MHPHSHGNRGFPICINGYCIDQQQSQNHPPQHQQQWQLGHVVPIPNPHVHASSILIHPTFASLIEKQGKETSQLINNQNGQMKLMLQQHQRELLVASQKILTIKNEEIVKAAKKTQEMENLLRSLEVEKRELEKIVEERSATIITLHNNLEEEKKRPRMILENDAESCCGENEEARAEKRVKRGNNIMFCPKCNTNSSSVLFLPCRHISSCKECEALLEACPICGMEKKGVIEIQS